MPDSLGSVSSRKPVATKQVYDGNVLRGRVRRDPHGVKVRVALRLRISRSVCTLCPLSALRRSKLARLRGSRYVTLFRLARGSCP